MGRDGSPLEKLFFSLEQLQTWIYQPSPALGEDQPPVRNRRGALAPAVMHVTATLTEIELFWLFFFPPLDLFSWSRIGSVLFERLAPSPQLQGTAEPGASPPRQRRGAEPSTQGKMGDGHLG